MENIKEYANELEDLILGSLNQGLTFEPSEIESEWNKLYPEIPFKSVITELFSQNKVGMVAKNLCEYRDPKRTD